jgi:putative addiction module component (TIGR02574 family)
VIQPLSRYNFAMSPTLERLRKLAMQLPYGDRRKLSEELWWSLHPPAEDLPKKEIDAAWGDEIKRRIDEIDSGAVKMIPQEEVLVRMDARIAAKRRVKRESR